jgi:hypothetical protein
MAQKNLNEFLAFYNGHGEHPVTEIELPNAFTENGSPFIILRNGGRVMVINPIAFDSHLSVDVHSYIDGEPATAGAFGMTEGSRYELEETGTTSAGFPSAPLVAILLGKQAEV